ncbi:MAG: signal recognition particle-docking protein FtsY [Saccharospirillaceae bacterium]|nr:signal recognition particle-docking protein FtsY [Pseudomonadales bacterium]NRB79524.1 signal recognition particle-docking protein FtsY [Saccharospirillaceae bacterium]
MFGFIKRKKNKAKENKESVQKAEIEQPLQQSIPAEPQPEIVAPNQATQTIETTEPTQQITETAQQQTSIKPESTIEIKAETKAEIKAETTIAPKQENNGVTLSDEPSIDPVKEKKGWFTRVKQGLSRTRANFSDGKANIFLGKKVIDDELFEDIETQLLMADVGVEATQSIIKDLTEKSARKELTDPQAMFTSLKKSLADMLVGVDQPLVIDTSKKPYVILMVGINGVGKTTTIGKLAKKYKKEGKSVMLAAGDTFRAAAVEQLQAWGDRNDVPVIAQHTGADSASVLYDALSAATSRNVDVLIADTAGRLHTKDNLMSELEKIVRVMKKTDESAPHEVMLVLDAGTGQNAINQAREFNKCVNVTGLTLSKLDGTAKGGVIFALAKQLHIPIRFIGVGEQADDLRDFNAKDFVKALFETNE